MNSEMLRDFIHRYERSHNIVSRHMTVLIKQLLPKTMTTEQFSVLRTLWQDRAQTSTELAEHFCVGKSAITSVIERLVQKGLVIRRPSTVDRRITCLDLTAEGEQVCEMMEAQIEQDLAKDIVSFDLATVKSFVEMFEQLAERMEQRTRTDARDE